MSMRTFLLFFVAGSGFFLSHQTRANLIVNGQFNAAKNGDEPHAWTVFGNADIQQQLTADRTSTAEPAAKLVCRKFFAGGKDSHAGLCQLGKIAVADRHWYRIRFEAKAEKIHPGRVHVSLDDCKRSKCAGLDEVFEPGGDWRSFEFVFSAIENLSATNSRLSFWFTGTGTLWLKDAVLAEISGERKLYPEISTEGVKNFVPNSSFECGGANWGSYTPACTASGWEIFIGWRA